jgi:hypothetical protein
MRFRTLCLLWLVSGTLLAACSPTTPVPLPEIITPVAPILTEAPAMTATPHPAGIPTGQPFPTRTSPQVPVSAWCQESLVDEKPPPGDLRIGMVKDNDVWIWEQEGTSRQLTEHGDVGQVFLSDDGQVAVYTRPSENGMVELWKVNVFNGKSEVVLSADEFGRTRRERGQLGVIPYNVSWVPGTHRLAFNTYPVVRGEGIWIYIPDDLQIIDVDTKELTTLFPIGSGGHFSLSPDGKALALFSPDSFEVYSIEGQALQSGDLEEYRAIAYGEYYGYAWPQWSPESDRLLVAIPGDIDPLRTDARLDIWEVQLDGSQPVLIKSFQSYRSEAVISPDLQKIAYWTQPTQLSNERELRIMEVYADDDIVFAQGNIMERFQWLPDSEHYLFWYTDSWDPWLGHLCKEAVKLPGLAMRSDIQWVDGERYLYLSGDEGSWSLYLGDLKAEQILVENLGESYSFAFASLP